MRVEQDQQSLDDSLDIAVGSSSPSNKSIKSSENKKRKSEGIEVEDHHDVHPVKTAKKANDTLKSSVSKKVTEEENKQSVAGNTQMQSLREKIESFSTNKTNPSSTRTKSTRTFSSMSTHAVGLGTSKISSPIFSRSNSQINIVPEPQSPSRSGKVNEEEKTKLSYPINAREWRAWSNPEFLLRPFGIRLEEGKQTM